MKIKQLFILVFLIFLCSCGNDSKPLKFDSDTWKAGTQIERGNMSTDLIESRLLIGKNKIQIIELLGPPKDSMKTNFHYLVDFGYMTPFHLDVNFDVTQLKVKEVILTD